MRRGSVAQARACRFTFELAQDALRFFQQSALPPRIAVDSRVNRLPGAALNLRERG